MTPNVGLRPPANWRRFGGYRYLAAGQVANLPCEELLARVEAIPVRNDKPDKAEAAAILGGASEPPITVSRALALYWTLTADETLGKSEDQIRRWKNPRKKAVANFIAVVGDKVLADISGDDMLDFRQWWTEKLAAEDLIHLGAVMKTINKRKRLGLVLPWACPAGLMQACRTSRLSQSGGN